MNKQTLNTLLSATVLVGLAFFPQVGKTENVGSRIKKIEQELSLLKREKEVEQEKKDANAGKFANVELGKKGLKILSEDKKYELSLNGYFQFDYRSFLDDKTGRDEFLSRRLRPVLQFKANDASFRLMPDFSGSTTRVFDAHADYKFYDSLQLRIGKFKPPLSLERLQSAADLFFVERGHANNLAPSRDFGFQIYGQPIVDQIEYQIGVFNGNADLANTDSDDDNKKDIFARIFTHPFKEGKYLLLRGLGIGIAASKGEREGSSSKPILGDYRTPGQQAFFKYKTNVFAEGTHQRLYPQAYWFYNNFGVIAEYATSKQNVKLNNSTDELNHKAYNLSASYVLTGEDINFKGGVKPAKDFNPKENGYGAFEVVGRVGETKIDKKSFGTFADSSSSAKDAKSYGGGVNWYLNENVKVSADYDFTTFDKGAALNKDRPDEKAILSRVQFKF